MNDRTRYVVAVIGIIVFVVTMVLYFSRAEWEPICLACR